MRICSDKVCYLQHTQYHQLLRVTHLPSHLTEILTENLTGILTGILTGNLTGGMNFATRKTSKSRRRLGKGKRSSLHDEDGDGLNDGADASGGHGVGKNKKAKVGGVGGGGKGGKGSSGQGGEGGDNEALPGGSMAVLQGSDRLFTGLKIGGDLSIVKP